MSNTIEGFETLSPQQIFDMSAKHILATKQKSVKFQSEKSVKFQSEKLGTVCVYGGSGCGASIFLTESAREEFDRFSGDPDMLDGGAWSRLVIKKLVPDTNADLIIALQCAHDNSPEDDGFMDSWVTSMQKVAKKFDLELSVLEQANV